MKSSLIDVPVAMIFFSRPDQFKRIFDTVKIARPSKLFLIMDGPRENREDDIKNTEICKKIAEDIDWECEIHRNYSDINLGCGKRISTGLSWAFEYVDRLIIFEDDTLPSQSWFKFAANILEYYKNDERIGMITGVNHLGKYEADGISSYFFTTCGSIAGWATWKRVWDCIDYDVTYAENEYYCELIKRNYYPKWKANRFIKLLKKTREIAVLNKKRNSWSGPYGFMAMLQSRLIIVPTVNMIKNIGVGTGATNGGTHMAILPKKLQSIFEAPTYEIEGKIIHPQYVIEDRIYNDKLQEIMNGGNNPLKRLLRKIETLTRILLVKHLKLVK